MISFGYLLGASFLCRARAEPFFVLARKSMYAFLTILARAGEDLNKSPYAKYFMIVTMLIGGPILIFNGIRGVKERRTTVTRRYRSTRLTGSQAVLAGWVQIGIGALFIIVALLTLVFR